MFGLHLRYDGYECNKEKLSSIDCIYDFLQKICSLIEMTPISTPHIVRYVPNEPEKKELWGISGVLLIAESHISCHTFPEKRFVTVDVYSCRMFDLEKTKDFITNFFEVKNVECEYSKRGLNF